MQEITSGERLYFGPLSYAASSKAREGRQLWDGGRLKELREAVGVSQDDVAKSAAVGAAEISRHERNVGTSNPTIAVLARIARALKVPLWTLFQPVGSPIPRPDGTEDEGEIGSGARVGLDPDLEGIRARFLEIIDHEHPAPDTIEGDVLKAYAILDHAVRRLARAGATRRASGDPDG